MANEGVVGQNSESDVHHRVGGFTYHRREDRWEWSDEVARIHGYSPGQIVPTTELVLAHKHPDDRRQVMRSLMHAIRTSGGPFSSRHRIIDTAGVTRSVVVVGDRVVGDSGEIVGSSGFYIDVTETFDSTVKKSVDEKVNEIAVSRSVIEQAKGMLMVVYGIPADRAFDILVWRSQETNVKVREVAEHLTARVLDSFHVPTALRTRFDHLLLQS